MVHKSFEKWKIGELHHAFDLTRYYKNFKILEDWLKSEHSFDATEEERLEELKEDLVYNADIWNEDELKFFFISQLVTVCRLKSKYYKIFTQRRISAKVNDIKLSGIVDFVIAQGIDEPEKPFFFIHEYKQEKKHANDPLAQLLSAMLAAQELNKHPLPLYGCYVLGRFWFFVVLKDKEYAVSNAYNASDEDIYKIASLLKEMQHTILKHLGKLSDPK